MADIVRYRPYSWADKPKKHVHVNLNQNQAINAIIKTRTHNKIYTKPHNIFPMYYMHLGRDD